jgi:integrase/recombinase XerD
MIFLLKSNSVRKIQLEEGATLRERSFGSVRQRGLIQRYHTLPWIPSEQDWKAILPEVQKKSTRVRLMFALGCDAALRREELCSIQVPDIDPSRRMLRIRAEVTKNRLERVVPYSIHTRALYQQYLQKRRGLGNGRGRLFLSSTRRNRGESLSLWTWSKSVKQLAKDSSVEHFTTHTPRHLRLTDLARAGWDVHEIATFAGHRSIQTRLGYIHLSGGELAEKLERTLADVDIARLRVLTGATR